MAYSDLPAKPIMVYPRSEEERKMIKQAARASRRGLSPFFVNLAQEHIKKTHPEAVLAAAMREYANEIVVHDDMAPEDFKLRKELLETADLLTRRADLQGLTPEAQIEFIKRKVRTHFANTREYLRLYEKRHPSPPPPTAADVEKQGCRRIKCSTHGLVWSAPPFCDCHGGAGHGA